MASPYRFVPLLSPTYRVVRRFTNEYLYSGGRVACPLCERTFRSWVGGLQHGLCPYCRSAARHRLLWLYLAEDWKAPPATRDLLHLAPEWGLQRRFRKDPRLARYVTADKSAPEADVHTDITAMTFADGHFDAIVCCHVLELIPDDRAAMREMVRVLRPGGVAYIQIPFAKENPQTDEDPSITDPRERERRFGEFDHVRVYGRDITDRLYDSGFSVTQVWASEILDADQMTRWGLWDDVIFRCERSDGKIDRVS